MSVPRPDWALWTQISRSLRYSGSPLRSSLRALPILTDLRGHLALSKVLSAPHACGLVERWPKVTFKYLSRYLACEFTRRERLAILTHHYRYLGNYVDERFLLRLFEKAHVLWEEQREDGALVISLSYPTLYGNEGDFSLTFAMNGTRLYEMSFTIVPCDLLRIPGQDGFLVTHVQGTPDNIDLIRQATKLCEDSSPPHLLLAAITGIATPLNISTLVGIGTGSQLSKEPDNPAFTFDYDAFWTSFGAARVRNFYLKSLPFEEKPVDLIRKKHRSRSIRRRQLRSEIVEKARLSFCTLCGVPVGWHDPATQLH